MSTKKLGRGAAAFLALITTVFMAVGVAGGAATFINLRGALGSASEAASVVLVGEGAVLVASLVCVGLAMMGQAAPALVRAALWLLPLMGSGAGAYLADGAKDSVVFAMSPLAMAAGAEGVNLIARRVVAYKAGRDVNAEARNAALVAAVAFQQGRAINHPLKAVRKLSALRAWSLAGRTTVTDARLVERLADVHGERLTASADAALAAMLPAAPSGAPALPAAPADGEGDEEPDDPGVYTEAHITEEAAGVVDAELARVLAESDWSAEPVRLDVTCEGISPDTAPDHPAGPVRTGTNLRAAESKHTDAELMEAGRRIMAELDPPRTQNKFFTAMRAEGFRGSRDRMTAVHKALKAELDD
jgi:hypothetical protein